MLCVSACVLSVFRWKNQLLRLIIYFVRTTITLLHTWKREHIRHLFTSQPAVDSWIFRLRIVALWIVFVFLVLHFFYVCFFLHSVIASARAHSRLRLFVICLFREKKCAMCDSNNNKKSNATMFPVIESLCLSHRIIERHIISNKMIFLFVLSPIVRQFAVCWLRALLRKCVQCSLWTTYMARECRKKEQHGNLSHTNTHTCTHTQRHATIAEAADEESNASTFNLLFYFIFFLPECATKMWERSEKNKTHTEKQIHFEMWMLTKNEFEATERTTRTHIPA